MRIHYKYHWESQARGAKMANKGKPKTKTHRKHISQTMKKSLALHSNDFVVAEHYEQSEHKVLVFKTCAEAARHIGATKQAVAAAIKTEGRKVRGWQFKYVSAEALAESYAEAKEA